MPTIRVLQPDEWSCLRDHPSLGGLAAPGPDAARIIIAVDDESQLVGYWMIVAAAHLEPAWIAPAHRGTLLAGRLWTALRAELSSLNIPFAFAFAETDDIRDYLDRLGFKPLPYSVHVYEEPGKSFPLGQGA